MDLSEAERVLAAVVRWLPTAEARYAVMGDNLDLMDRALIRAARQYVGEPGREPSAEIDGEPEIVQCPKCSATSQDLSAHMADYHPIVVEIPPECANCAPLAAGASTTRVDGTGPDAPCEDCRETFPCTWNQVRTGDEVQGEDGNWYRVKGSGASALGTLHAPIQVVTLLIGERENTYDMPGLGPVRIRLGDEHRAIRALKAGFPGTEEIR